MERRTKCADSQVRDSGGLRLHPSPSEGQSYISHDAPANIMYGTRTLKQVELLFNAFHALWICLHMFIMQKTVNVLTLYTQQEDAKKCCRVSQESRFNLAINSQVKRKTAEWNSNLKVVTEDGLRRKKVLKPQLSVNL